MLDSYILISSGLSRIRTQIIRCKGQSLDSSQSKLKCLISKMFHVIKKILFMQNILFTSMYGANRIQMEKFNTLLTNVSIKSCLSCCTFLSQGGWVNRLRNIFTLLVYFFLARWANWRRCQTLRGRGKPPGISPMRSPFERRSSSWGRTRKCSITRVRLAYFITQIEYYYRILKST